MGRGRWIYIDRYGMSRDKLRTMKFDEQSGRCALCKNQLPKRYLTSRSVNLDHRIPRARPHNGPDTIENLQLTHSDCNSLKGDRCPGCEGCS